MAKLKLHLDRSVPASLTEQIKGQITYAISYGLLNRGDLLPSVRELATTLKIAPMTVTHVYRDLARQGLIVTKAGVGTFVADMARLQENAPFQASQDNLYHIVESCLRQATLLGHTVDQVQDAFLTLANEYRSADSVQHVLVVGNFAAATEDYAQQIENILCDLDVRAHPVLLSDLLSNPDDTLAHCKATKLVITVPPRLQEVRALLEPLGYRVAAIAFHPSADTRRRLASISRERDLGIVATFPEHLQTLVDEVAAHILLKKRPLCAHLGLTKRIREMLKRIDVLIYASGSEKVLDWLPARVEAIEFRHAPDADSVNRLRPLIV